MKTTFIGLVVAVICFSETYAACSVQDIPRKDIVYQGKTMGVELAFKDRPTGGVDIYFTQWIPRKRSDIVREYRQQLATNMPADHCGFTANLNQTHAWVSGKELSLATGVSTRLYLCVKTNGTCCKGLRCKACEWIWRDENIGFRKTLNLYTNFVPTFSVNEDQAGQRTTDIVVTAHSHWDELSRLEQILQSVLTDIARILYMSSFQLIDMREVVEFSLPALPVAELLREQFSGMDNFRPRVTDVAFTGDYDVSVKISSEESRSCGIAEEIYAFFNNFERINAQRVISEKTYTVARKGESLWQVALQEYGDGRYYLPLAQHNGLERKLKLKLGQTLKIPTFAKLTSDYEYVVVKGDSIWSIANKLNIPFSRLKREYRQKGRHSLRVFPSELLFQRSGVMSGNYQETRGATSNAP